MATQIPQLREHTELYALKWLKCEFYFNKINGKKTRNLVEYVVLVWWRSLSVFLHSCDSASQSAVPVPEP